MLKLLMFTPVLLLLTNITQANIKKEQGKRGDLFKIETTEKNKYVSGQVEINFSTSSISVLLLGPNNCPEGARCFAGPINKSIKVPLKVQNVDNCKIKTYKGEIDARPVDGAYKEITVFDATESICEMKFLAPISVTFNVKFHDRINDREIEMSGSAFSSSLKSF